MTVLADNEISIASEGDGATRLEGSGLSIEPASIDLHLGHQFAYPYKENNEKVVVDDESTYPDYSYEEAERHTIEAGQFVLAHTDESINIPPEILGLLHGRSSVGRLGTFIHNAGLIDPGFNGQVTLELFNPMPWAIELVTGMRIGQMTYHTLSSAPDVQYSKYNSNKYNGQMGATPSRLFKDFD